MDIFHKKLDDFYTKQVKLFGPNDNKSISWSSRANQTIRFKVLSEVANLEGKQILDVGSGLGDLSGFLQNKHIKYTGVELSWEQGKTSREKYGNIEIIHANFFDYTFHKKYDYVLCSGAFNCKHENHRDYLYNAIRKMFSLAKSGVAFNLPSNMGPWVNQDSSIGEQGIEIAYVDPTEIFTFCKSLAQKVILRHDYLPHDFSIYLYK